MSAGGSGSEKTEPTMSDMPTRLSAIEEVTRSLQPLADRFAVMETTVKEQQQQQVALNLALSRIEHTVAGGRNATGPDVSPCSSVAGLHQRLHY